MGVVVVAGNVPPARVVNKANVSVLRAAVPCVWERHAATTVVAAVVATVAREVNVWAVNVKWDACPIVPASPVEVTDAVASVASAIWVFNVTRQDNVLLGRPARLTAPAKSVARMAVVGFVVHALAHVLDSNALESPAPV